jgi:cytochrome c peroxidase
MRAALVLIACALAACVAPQLRETQLRRAPTDFDWRLPPGFPAPPVPADNPMSTDKVTLGRDLFHDQRLSFNGTISCASCHAQALGFTDGHARAIGATGEAHPRSSMQLANVAYNSAFTWIDREPHSLEEQMLQPLLNEQPIEMGLRSHESLVLGRFAGDEHYHELFARAFPGDAAPVSLANVVRAIASFERTLISGRSSFDRYLFDDDQAALSSAAKRGMDLFFSKRGGCAQCHSGLTLGGAQALYANTGVERGTRNAFRIPSLRNVEVTAPYMHDGSLSTLDDVLDHYSAGGRFRSHDTDRRIRALKLSTDERRDLLEFMKSLTDREFLTDSRFARP